jgi:hypothetical protein
VDAISSLVAGAQRVQATFDNAAQQLAAADVPTAAAPDATDPVVPDPSNSVDVAEQMTTMMIAGDQHLATTAALKSALELYKQSVDLLIH